MVEIYRRIAVFDISTGEQFIEFQLQCITNSPHCLNR
jgi:hypothetical protein